MTIGSFTRLTAVLSLCILCFTADAYSQVAQSPDSQFVKIYSTVSDADALKASGKKEEALKKYHEAYNALLELKRNSPAWNSKIVANRLNSLSETIAALSQPVAADSVGTGTESAPTAKATGGSPSGPVKLLSAGAEPRRALRLEPQPGQKQTVGMTMKIGMEMQMGTAPGQPMNIPTIQLTMEALVKSVEPNGDIVFETVVTDAAVSAEPGAMDGMVNAMNASMAGIKGLTTSSTITSRGITKASEVVSMPGADPQVRQSMEQMKDAMTSVTTQFPEEPVGPGAKWVVKLPIKSQGMTIQQTTTFELVSVESDLLKLNYSLTQNAANQKIQNPAIPGVTLDLKKMSGKGAGSSTIELGRLLPSAATGNFQTTLSMGMQKQPMNMKMDMDIRMEQK